MWGTIGDLWDKQKKKTSWLALDRYIVITCPIEIHWEKKNVFILFYFEDQSPNKMTKMSLTVWDSMLVSPSTSNGGFKYRVSGQLISFVSFFQN